MAEQRIRRTIPRRLSFRLRSVTELWLKKERLYMSAKHWIGLVVGTLLALGVALWVREASGNTTLFKDLVSVVVGAVGECIVILFVDMFHASEVLRRMNQSQHRLAESFHRSQRELLDALQSRVAKAEDLGHVFQYVERELSKSEVPRVWVDLVSRFQQEYYATNYIQMGEIYTTDWADAALAVQNGKKRASDKVTIKKVFLIDNENEMYQLAEHLKKQRELGIRIHYLFRREIDQDEELRSKVYELPSPDFGIFDNDHVLVWELDGRTLKGGRVLFSQEQVRRHREFFEALFTKAEQWSKGVRLTAFCGSEREKISQWPEYPHAYADLDYALRPGNGWLYTFGEASECIKYGAYANGEFIGFCLLHRDKKNSPKAEFYIAIHPERLGQGFGTAVTKAALSKAFNELGMNLVHLKVRKNHPDIALYQNCGYVHCGETKEVVNGKETEFYKMQITADKSRANSQS
jgi:RimJ/RimL family protein N-acetyltransferase